MNPAFRGLVVSKDDERRRRTLGPNLSIRLPDDVHARAVAAALDLKVSLNAVVVAALEHALSEDK